MYDLIIIGLGPAGINACIYAKRSNLNILVFEKNMPGGTLHTIKHVDNYLGYNNVDGTELAMLFYKQFKELKVPMKNEEVIKVELNGNKKIIKKINGKDKIESIELNDKTLTIDGLFINNEYGPITSFVKELGITNEKGYIIADDNGKTKIDGIYVCGDSKEKTLYQIITAASEGALAATDAYKYIKNYK